jgi:hypothetical protein
LGVLPAACRERTLAQLFNVTVCRLPHVQYESFQDEVPMASISAAIVASDQYSFKLSIPNSSRPALYLKRVNAKCQVGTHATSAPSANGAKTPTE